MKRILLFILTNLAILLMISIVASVTGLDAWLARQGRISAACWCSRRSFGFSGSLISLAISKWMAVRSMGVRIIEQPANADRAMAARDRALARERAGVGMPEVGIFDSPQPNAFATGPRRDHALVAVSRGCCRRWIASRSRRCSAMRSLTWPTATW